MIPRWQPLIRVLARWITPPADRQWIGAMISEWHYLPKDYAASKWLLACLQAAFSFRLRDRWSQFAGASTALAALMIGLDWDVNSTEVSVALICLSSFTLALLWPVRTATAGLFGGATLPAAHAVANFWPPLWPLYQYKPLDGFDWLILVAVLLPSVLFAAIGVQLRRGLGGSI